MAKVRKIDAIHSAPPRLKRVAAYARVSMETERLKHSLSAQISYYSDLIQKHPGWVYAGVFADDGVTGTKANRPEFQRLLQECEAGRIDIVLTKSISRFARNTVDLLETVRHLKELGIEVQFEKEQISSLSDDGELMLTLLASFAQEESRSISENVSWGIRKCYENGKSRNCRIYGYRVVDGQFVIMEDEAAVVRRIYRMFLDGESCYYIAKHLNEEGRQSFEGSKFRGDVISYMLRQEKYAGCELGQKYYSTDHITHKQRTNRGELPRYFIEGCHPAIISMDTFLAAQEEFSQRYGVRLVDGLIEQRSSSVNDGASTSSWHPRWTEKQKRLHADFFRGKENTYPFSWFLRCEGCGANLWGSKRLTRDGSTVIHWVCGRHNKTAPGTPRPVPLLDEELRQQVAEAMNMEAMNENEMHSQLNEISVNVDRITLHYKDGRTQAFQYVHKRRKRNGNS